MRLCAIEEHCCLSVLSLESILFGLGLLVLYTYAKLGVETAVHADSTTQSLQRALKRLKTGCSKC